MQKTRRFIVGSNGTAFLPSGSDTMFVSLKEGLGRLCATDWKLVLFFWWRIEKTTYEIYYVEN